MRQKLIFEINSKEYEKGKYSFQNDNFMININNVDIKKIALSTKTLYGDKSAYKYHVGYLNDKFKQLNIVIKDTELCATNTHILTNHTNFLNYVEIWDKIVSLLNKNTTKSFGYDIEYIKPKISPYNENRHDINKRLKKGDFYGTLILSIDSIFNEVGRLYPQTFLKKLFGCNNNTLKKPIQIIDKSSDGSSNESSDECIYEPGNKSNY